MPQKKGSQEVGKGSGSSKARSGSGQFKVTRSDLPHATAPERRPGAGRKRSSDKEYRPQIAGPSEPKTAARGGSGTSHESSHGKYSNQSVSTSSEDSDEDTSSFGSSSREDSTDSGPRAGRPGSGAHRGAETGLPTRPVPPSLQPSEPIVFKVQDPPVSSTDEKRTHYELLGVAQNATPEEISKAFRKLARRCHPDHNSAATATSRFQTLSAAKDVLLDARSRRIYDASIVIANDPTDPGIWAYASAPYPPPPQPAWYHYGPAFQYPSFDGAAYGGQQYCDQVPYRTAHDEQAHSDYYNPRKSSGRHFMTPNLKGDDRRQESEASRGWRP